MTDTSKEAVDYFIGRLEDQKVYKKTPTHLEHVRLSLFGMEQIRDLLHDLVSERDRLREALEELLFENSDKSEGDRLKTRIKARLALEAIDLQALSSEPPRGGE